MKIGTDIIEIQRIHSLLEKYGDTFKNRFLTPDEIIFAGLWAAKEAISKALGCGISATLTFHDIHIFKNSKGAPYFTLSQKANRHYPINSASLSISHDGGFAIAVVVIDLKK